jgi:site-specific DNA recombinase
MKKAIIYVRVSTDEQAEKGFSLQHQEERIRGFCLQQGIEVVGFYKEDYSAKSFNRPAFTELLAFLKRHRGSAHLLLFLKWDRFSRNAGDAYGMINQLNKLGVEPQAIEQPLNLDVPENKMMLAFYLASPEVENDRRALNVISGTRRANKEGRFTTTAPKGYRNGRNEANRPIIVLSDDAPLVRWVFERVAERVFNVKDVWREAQKKGLKVGRSNIFNLLRNPVYMGKLFVPAYKDEEAMLVKGIHEPIVSEFLFYEVQDVLDGRKRKSACWSAKDELPLRGFLFCPKCDAKLTGSGSKGNGGVYFYYHCVSSCGVRFKAELANDLLVEELRKLSVNEGSIALFEAVVKGLSGDYRSVKRSELKLDEVTIDKNKQRIAQAQQLMLDGELSIEDYRDIKGRYETELVRLQQKGLAQKDFDNSLNEHVLNVTRLLRNLSQYYVSASLSVKQKIIGSIFSEKLVFENNAYRTISFNKTIELICRTGKDFKGIKKGLNTDSDIQSNGVNRIGFEPMTLSLEG